MSDEPTFEEVLAGMEGAMGDSTGAAGIPGGTSGAQAGGTGPGGSAAGSASPGYPGPTGTGQQGGGQQGGGLPSGDGNRGGGNGPLTPAEQVAILDGRLEQGTGEFDAMILEEQTQQRQATRSGAGQQAPAGATGDAASGNGTGGGSGDYGVARNGSYGGGIGGAGGGSGVPQNTAKYPPPDDIPNGNDDDVVARQLREAAMREPDPAVREKLWEEYRKYKGISK